MAVALLFLLSVWCAFIGTGVAWFCLKACRSGVLRTRSRQGGRVIVVRRGESPAAFWSSMAVLFFGIAVSYAFALGLFLNALAFSK